MCNWKCPACGKSDHSGCDLVSVTDMYFPPRYVDGVNVNPDRNGRSSTITCNACGKRFRHEVSPHTSVVSDTEIKDEGITREIRFPDVAGAILTTPEAAPTLGRKGPRETPPS